MTEPTPPVLPPPPPRQAKALAQSTESPSLGGVLDQAWLVVEQLGRLLVMLTRYLWSGWKGGLDEVGVNLRSSSIGRLLALAVVSIFAWLQRLVREVAPPLVRAGLKAWERHVVQNYFRQPVRFSVALPLLLGLSAVVYTRSFYTNYIFDEQEALLANPYVNGEQLGYWDVFSRDFWGLPSTHTIGSYRPLPNMIWRPIWYVLEHPWPPHFFNVLMHGVNAALVAALMTRWLGSRRASWFAGLAFCLSAVITEAVCGVVGIADVLSGFFILLVLLGFGAQWYWQLPIAGLALFCGLLSKESVITATPVVAWAALVMAPVEHPNQPQRWRRLLCTALGAAGAVVAYTYFRRAFFEVQMPPHMQKPLGPEQPFVRQAMHEFLRWFRQPQLPVDPINNPLVNAQSLERISGALRVYFRGLVQVVFPWQLSGDYSFPQEPIPRRLLSSHSVLGGLLLLGPVATAVGLWLRCLWTEYRERFRTAGLSDADPSDLGRSQLNYRMRSLFAVSLLWIPITYFPHSNIPLLLPTVRAERFWYIPVVASAFMIGAGWYWLFRRALDQNSDATQFAGASVPGPPSRFLAGSDQDPDDSAFGVRVPNVAGESSAAKGNDFSNERLPHALSRSWAVFISFWFRGQVKWAVIAASLFFGFQAVRARAHALDYADDLTFWAATVEAVPYSAKAHLNYGVMLGARGRLQERLAENRRALELAPQWPMGNIYYADTLCRLDRVEEAWPHYAKGFTLGPNQQSLISLGLQCLWEKKAIEPHKAELEGFARDHGGSWLAFLTADIVKNGEKHNGVDPKYRPRSYDGGPR